VTLTGRSKRWQSEVRRIAELQSISATLSHLLAHCHGDARPVCAILEALQVDQDARATNAQGKAPARRRRAPRPTSGRLKK
jgi:hypothetical protein